jgi:AcrR family transcriptional regulator
LREYLIDSEQRAKESVASKIVAKILEGATELFAKQGYFGASTRDLALKADVAEPSIYRLFLNKEKLFHECLTAVIEQSLDPGQFQTVISVLEPGEGFSGAVGRAIRRWYFSLSAQSARLLMQAALSDNKEWTEMAYSRIDKIIGVLAKHIEKETETSKAKAIVAARTLILALFQFKIARPMLSSAEKERNVVDATIDQWLQGLT